MTLMASFKDRYLTFSCILLLWLLLLIWRFYLAPIQQEQEYLTHKLQKQLTASSLASSLSSEPRLLDQELSELIRSLATEFNIQIKHYEKQSHQHEEGLASTKGNLIIYGSYTACYAFLQKLEKQPLWIEKLEVSASDTKQTKSNIYMKLLLHQTIAEITTIAAPKSTKNPFIDKTTTKPSSKSKQPQLQLEGIVHIGSGHTAIIRLGEKRYFLKPGDWIQQQQLLRVQKNHAYFQDGPSQHTYILSVLEVSRKS